MEPMTLPSHFPMAPSSSKRWLNCPGSIGADDGGSGGDAADFGTAGHAWAHSWLSGQPIDPVNLERIKGYSEERRSLLRDLVTAGVEFVHGLKYPEKRYETQIPSNLIPEHGGTVDVIAADDEELHVVDFKFGRVFVEAEGNTQLLCYLLLATQLYPGRKRFKATIVQPILGYTDTVDVTPDELEAFTIRLLRASVSDNFAAGDHCEYCPLGVSCLTLAQFVRDCAEDFDAITVDEKNPTEGDIEQTARATIVYDIAVKVLEGAREKMRKWAEEGRELPYDYRLIRQERLYPRADTAEKLIAHGFAPEHVYQTASMTSIAKAAEVPVKAFRADFGDLFDSREYCQLRRGKATPSEFSEFDDLLSGDSSGIID